MFINEFDWQGDIERREAHRQLLICLQAKWKRVLHHGAGQGCDIQGPHGQQFKRLVEATIHGDERDKYHRIVNHVRYYLMFDASFNLLKELVRKTALIYGKKMQVRGPLAESDGWKTLQAVSSLHAIQRAKLRSQLGLYSAVVRSTMSPHPSGGYFPAGLCVVPPHRVTVIPYPNNALSPMVVIEHLGQRADMECSEQDAVAVCDLSDPGNPKWTQWSSLTKWKRSFIQRMSPDGNVDYTGSEYPWEWNGEPISCYDVSQAQTTMDAVAMPVNEGAVEDTLQIYLERTRIRVKKWTAGRPRLVGWGNTVLDGWEAANNVDGGITYLHGNNKDMKAEFKELKSATDDVVKDSEQLWKYVDELANKHNGSVGIKKAAPEAAAALAIRDGELWRFRADQVDANRPSDTNLVKIQTSTNNYLVRSGSLNMDEIPEDDFELYYPVSWNAEQWQQALKEVHQAVVDGYASPVAEYLMRHELGDDGPEGPIHQAALERIRAEMVERKNLIVETGAGVAPEKLFGVGNEATRPLDSLTERL